MKPVDQDIFGPELGNCWAACIASILELTLSEVPNFGASGKWFSETWNWLLDRGMASIYDGPGSGIQRPNCYHIVSGKSPRGDWGHACVSLGTELVHDPHPSRAFLAGPVEDSWVIVPREIIRIGSVKP